MLGGINMKSEKEIKKAIKLLEDKLKSGILCEQEADSMLEDLDEMIEQLEQIINNNVNKLNNKL